MNIGEVSKTVKLPIKTIRYYADINLVSPSARSNAGYRQYDTRSVQKLIFIRRARAFGFSVKECHELLSLYEDKNRTAREVKTVAQKRLTEIEEKQRELQGLHDELASLIECCKGDEKPDCPIISSLAK